MQFLITTYYTHVSGERQLFHYFPPKSGEKPARKELSFGLT